MEKQANGDVSRFNSPVPQNGAVGEKDRTSKTIGDQLSLGYSLKRVAQNEPPKKSTAEKLGRF